MNRVGIPLASPFPDRSCVGSVLTHLKRTRTKEWTKSIYAWNQIPKNNHYIHCIIYAYTYILCIPIFACMFYLHVCYITCIYIIYIYIYLYTLCIPIHIYIYIYLYLYVHAPNIPGSSRNPRKPMAPLYMPWTIVAPRDVMPRWRPGRFQYLQKLPVKTIGKP